MKIVLLESLAVSDEVLQKYTRDLEQKGHTFCAYSRCEDEAALCERAKDADILLLANMPLKGSIIRQCTHLQFIDVAFTGVDHVDLQAAEEMHVAVSNASGYSNESVAEFALGMAIDCLRNVEAVSARCRQQGTREGLVGRELGGKTVGIIGFGKIGRRAAELFHAFGCPILAYDSSPIAQMPDYVQQTSLDELLRHADVVSLHCPLVESTRGLMNAERISMMKHRAILINTSRGPVVDSQALADALNSGHLAAAAADVFEMEPPLPMDHPLLHSINTIVTPHIAFASDESMEIRAKIVFENIQKWMNKEQVNTIL